MRSRRNNAGEAGDAPFIVERVKEMEAYDELPPLLRLALDQANFAFSARQAKEMVDGGFDADRLAAAIMSVKEL